MARKITRRGLIGLGLSLGTMATLYPFLRWGYEITQPRRHAIARGVWFEKIGEAPSDGEVELRFVDEAGNPAEFSALLFWEPTGGRGDQHAGKAETAEEGTRPPCR